MTEDKFILDTEGLYPFQREAVEALMKANTVSIDVEGNEPRLYTLEGKSYALAALASMYFGKTVMVSHRPELIEAMRAVDYSVHEARILAAFDMLVTDEAPIIYGDSFIEPRYIPMPIDDSVPVYLIREDKPKKDNAPWRRIPHKRGRAKRNRR